MDINRFVRSPPFVSIHGSVVDKSWTRCELMKLSAWWKVLFPRVVNGSAYLWRATFARVNGMVVEEIDIRIYESMQPMTSALIGSGA